MKKSNKAILLSAFIFPGAGHVFLKHYITASALIILTLAPLYYLFRYLINSALEISNQIINGEITPDIMKIRELLYQKLANPESEQLDIAIIVLIVIWLISILDSYRIGRTKDRVKKSSDYS